MKKLIIIFILIFCGSVLFASEFDELDKPPEGAHQGQMLLGAFVSIGGLFGSIIDAEDNFLSGNTYTFSDNLITKKLEVSHLAFSFGISFEYMPFDYVGIKTKLKKTVVIQRTIFGSEFENWSESLYEDYSLYLGPAIHLISRKQWDFTLTPVAGFAFGNFTATPIAAELISGYSGNREKSVNNFTCGAELNFTAYFSGGLFISLGFDWTMNMLNFNEEFNLTQSSNTYFEGETESQLHTLSFILTAGYAFSN